MAIAHITAAQVAEFGLVSAPTIMNGTPQDNKARFDKMNRELVVVVVNSIIDQTNLLLVAEDTRTQQETGRVNAETLRVAAEQLRVSAEAARADAEKARSAAETARDSAEKNRDNAETARKTAQDAWVTAETARVAAEVLRVEAEKARVSAETARASAEQTRGQAETARGSAESNRATAETSRQTAEQGRSTDETARKNAESLRGTAEQGRVTAETGRTTADTARDTAEKARATAEAGRSDGEKARDVAESARKIAEDGRIERDSADSLCEPYNPLRDYVTGNKAVQNGSTYRCTAPCRGIAPPDSAKWLLVAAKGMDGHGSGDMLSGTYDPAGKGMDIFAFAETKKAEAVSAAATDATAKADAAREAAKAASVPLAQKGVAGGVATLDGSGTVPSGQLPSYVDDVLEFALKSQLPATGEQGKIYMIVGDTDKNNGQYRWTGTTYAPIIKALDFATKAEAEAGNENTKVMTALRTAEAIGMQAAGKSHGHTPAQIGFMYGICSTASAQADKVVSAGGFSLGQGAIAVVKFLNGVPNSATLNINGTGVYPIQWMGNAIEEGGILAGDTCEFVYTGSSWNLLVIDRLASVGGVVSVSFASDSWETIQKMCSNGKYKKCYAIGDTKPMLLSTGEKIIVRIEDFDHDDLESGGKAPLSIAFVDGMNAKRQMDSSGKNYGGWNATDYKAWTSTLLSQLPADLQPLIKTVIKKSSAGDRSSSIVTTTDKLWPFSYTEVGFAPNPQYSLGGEGTPYPFLSSNASRIKKSNGVDTHWWLRSPLLLNNTAFCIVSAGGGPTDNSSDSSYVVVLGFCI